MTITTFRCGYDFDVEPCSATPTLFIELGEDVIFPVCAAHAVHQLDVTPDAVTHTALVTQHGNIHVQTADGSLKEIEDPKYTAYCDEMSAIHEGRAVELTTCYLCPDDAPRRGVLSERIGGGSDPSMILSLSCGHDII